MTIAPNKRIATNTPANAPEELLSVSKGPTIRSFNGSSQDFPKKLLYFYHHVQLK